VFQNYPTPYWGLKVAPARVGVACRYVHGGYRLLLNSYLVQYFKNSCFGPGLGPRHNLEMYLHLLDHNRDQALVNKGDDVLTDDKEIPANWWDPVPHQGLIFDKKERKWHRPLSKSNEDYRGKQDTDVHWHTGLGGKE